MFSLIPRNEIYYLVTNKNHIWGQKITKLNYIHITFNRISKKHKSNAVLAEEGRNIFLIDVSHENDCQGLKFIFK